MYSSTALGILVAIVLRSASAGATDGAARPAASDSGTAWVRTAFVIGAPGRLDGDADHRAPRWFQDGESAVAAYVDVEVVQDPTWLRHEIEHYARRAVDCAGLAPSWCRRRVRQLGTAAVIDLASGAHGELVWLSGPNRAVRLGWRRIVASSYGTMTVEAPPAEFAAAVLAAFPASPQTFQLDGVADATWRADEIERLLYYAEQVARALPAVTAELHRRRAVQFVQEALGQVERLGAPPVAARQTDPLEALRAYTGRTPVRPWCVAEIPAADDGTISPADDQVCSLP